MSARIAIGVGCRRGCPANLIEALVQHALERLPQGERLGIFSVCDKAAETGLAEAAARLGLDLVFLPRAALRAQAPRIQMRSSRTEHLFGVPSVAEAAALAGAGADAVLIVARIANQGATCAVAGRKA